MYLFSLLNLNATALLDYKIYFAQQSINGLDPLNAFLRNQFQEWMSEEVTSKFDRKLVISFIYFRENEWLFVGFYEVIEISKNKNEIILLDQSIDLIGRLIVRYDRIQRKPILNLESCMDYIKLNEILKEKILINDFTSFKTTKVKYNLLKTIVKNESISWKKALTSAKGIYLVTDTKSGGLYVGAAYGEATFWDRWLDYAHNGHGGNRFLKKMMELNGKDYAYNLQFSF
jgi:hypothetical protein